MNQLSTTAEALKAVIAAADLGQAKTVTRCFVPPEYDSIARRDLQVFVIGFDETVDLSGATRNGSYHLYGVKVAMVKRIAATNPTASAALAELDTLSDVREKLIDVIKAAGAQVASASLDDVKNTATYDPATLAAKATFVSVIETNYRTLR